MEYDKSYINKLKSEKQRLVNILTSKGIECSNDETFTTLAPKIVAIDTGDYFKTVLDDNDSFSSGGSYYNLQNIFKKIPSIDLSQVSSSKIDKLNGIFRQCSNVIEIGKLMLPQGVTKLSHMYHGCKSLVNFDISDLDTSSVVNISYMFYGCNSITSVDLSNLDLSSVENMSYLFSNCTSLNSVTFPSSELPNVNNMSYFYNKCMSLETLIFPNLPQISINLSRFAYGAQAKTVIFPNVNATNFTYAFSESLFSDTVDVSNINFENITSLSYTFSNASISNLIGLSNKNYNSLTDISSCFNNFNKSIDTPQTIIDLSGSSFPSVTTSKSLFYYTKANTVNLSNCSFPSITSLNNCFRYSNIESLLLSNASFPLLSDISYIFSNCTINSIDDLNPLFSSSELTSINYAFNYANISGLLFNNRLNIPSKKLESMQYLFNRCTTSDTIISLGINLENDGIEKYIKANHAIDCGYTNTSVTSINILNLGTTNDTKIEADWFISNFSNLISIEFENFDFKVKKGSSLSIYNIGKLETINGIIDLTDYDSENMTKFYCSSNYLINVKVKGLNSSTTFYSNDLTGESIDYILNNVADTALVKPSTTYKIQFRPSALARASADAIAHAESLGWTVEEY